MLLRSDWRYSDSSETYRTPESRSPSLRPTFPHHFARICQTTCCTCSNAPNSWRRIQLRRLTIVDNRHNITPRRDVKADRVVDSNTRNCTSKHPGVFDSLSFTGQPNYAGIA